MSNLRFLTSGESHGKALTGILEGIPSGLLISSGDIDKDLSRRQKGYGRGGRMKIESDAVQILSGVRGGKTLGSPITLLIENKDWLNWQDVMNPEIRNQKSEIFEAITRPRPGHADLSGAIKYNTHDIRNVLERSSARETAARVAVGAIAKKLLSDFNIKIMGYVVEIGGVRGQARLAAKRGSGVRGQLDEKNLSALFKKAEISPVRCPDKKTEQKMIGRINKAMGKGDSLGGIFEVVVTGVPAGLGSYSQWDRRLNARLACALTGIQAIKGVEIGLGFEMSGKFGSEVMDEIFYRSQKSEVRSQKNNKQIVTAGGFYRKSNNAGGIEGGISNGMPISAQASLALSLLSH